MSTFAASQAVPQPPRRNPRRTDRIFFPIMIGALLAVVLWGFSRTYFLAGMVSAPLPNRLIHIHGAVFTIWMLLLITQTAFISAKRIQWHRALGMFGFGWAVLMVVMGLLASVDSLRRGTAPLGLDRLTFFVIPTTDILFFAIFIAFAYLWRTKVEAHKRLILIATLTIADAAIARLPIDLFQRVPPSQDLVTAAFLLLMVLYDLFSLRKFSRTTLIAGATLLIMHNIRVPLAMSHPWHAFVGHLL